ncbi:hypothetical protein CO110_05420 [Candidatus Desantisbacteria bacterium CG_4_9_14_3_um_filter_40_11]|uniref:Uncharacterized protein n=2 Tax=unclassified Candidatus Desantisiibacteriota TaxID=3106372 RepID=A0A2M7P0B6_9BACT|nr:MAG: hypothetical protein COZ13_07490 [Candidatus Desantisbacteria bacterium CG_4_10_14_3_um_filter_40_18]PJB29528.1 MAG: hypothetical protein CO110_05420 [Candidatus Desantisbacteria bacterium CG_4_9_14_3_um_filter_40_11]
MNNFFDYFQIAGLAFNSGREVLGKSLRAGISRLLRQNRTILWLAAHIARKQINKQRFHGEKPPNKIGGSTLK